MIFFQKKMFTPSENDEIRQILHSVVATSSRILYNMPYAEKGASFQQ